MAEVIIAFIIPAIWGAYSLARIASALESITRATTHGVSGK